MAWRGIVSINIERTTHEFVHPLFSKNSEKEEKKKSFQFIILIDII